MINRIFAMKLKQKKISLRHTYKNSIFLLVLFFTSTFIYANTDFSLSDIADKTTQDSLEKTVTPYYSPDVSTEVDKNQILKLEADQYQYVLVPISTKDPSDDTTFNRIESTGCYLQALTNDRHTVKKYLIKADSRLDYAIDPLTAGKCANIASIFKCKTAQDHGIVVIYHIENARESKNDEYPYYNLGIFLNVLPDGTLKENKALTAKLSTSTEVAKDALTAKKTLGCLR
jgi:hypothetical protein